MLGYSLYSGSKSVRGTLYMRNDRQKAYTRIALRRSNNFRVRVPNRLIRGTRLFYYAAFTDPRSRKALRLPARDCAAPDELTPGARTGGADLERCE